MELHEALRTIDATHGMLSFFLGKVLSGELKEKFLQTPIEHSIEEYYDGETWEHCIECKEYYFYRDKNNECKGYIVGIRPVCNYLINEWPSNKAKKIRKILRETFFLCFNDWKDILGDDLAPALEEGYSYDGWYKKTPEPRTIQTVMLDTFHEMSHALGLTEEDDDGNDAFLSSKKDLIIVDEIESSLHPELQKRIHDSYKRSHNNKSGKTIKCFREFIKDSIRTEEILEKIHRLIGNKTNTDALKIITRAMWIEWIDRPTATSIKNEFPTITCSPQVISRCLNEPRPTKKEDVDKIKKDFEQS